MSWKLSPRSAQEWSSVAPIGFGIFGLLICLVFWMATNRVEPLFVTTFGGLLALGAGTRALDAIRQPTPPPPEIPDAVQPERVDGGDAP